MPSEARPGVAGIVLAGGRSRRMGGGDKCLRNLGGETLLARAIARARPQVETLVLNANGDPGRFASYGLPVARDVVEGYAGPLAGVLTGMEWARAHAPECPWIVTFASDAPFFPDDLVARLMAAVEEGGTELACAASRGRSHPVFGLWPVRLAEALREALVSEEIRKIDRWTARYRLAEVGFADTAVDPFFNVNAPEDLAEAERLTA
jgi:molybdopterin-guanine dinucleotide biosynthesis protein A